MQIHYNNLEELRLKGVYLIRNLDNELLKIGKCEDLKSRFNGIKATFRHIGFEPNLNIESFIEYKYNSELENYLHKTFKSKRIKNEWFNIDDINVIIEAVNCFKFEPKQNKNVIKIEKRDSKNKELKYYKFKYYFNDTWYTIGFRSYYKDINFDYLNNICYELGYNQRYDYFYKYYDDMINDKDIIACEELKHEFKNIDCDYIIKVDDKWISIKEFLKPIIINIKKKEINHIKETFKNILDNFDNIDLNNYDNIKSVYNKMYEDIENKIYLNTQDYTKVYLYK